jgi:PKD repeat protein
VNVTANVSGNTLTWALSGAGLENTIDHYTVFISADGENLMPLADLPVGSRSFDLSSYQFLAGNYSVFVKAVAKPSLTNKMSNAATFVSTFVPNQPPNAQLALNASSLYAPSTITASTTGSFDPDGSIARSTIIWADGSTSAGPVASHAFGAGTYTITAIVTDNKGATASTSGTITILPAEVVISSPVDGTSLNSPVRVQAVANSGNAISTMTVFVDGMAAYSTAGASLTADVKISAGAHTITVQATDVVGAVTKNSVPINVVNLPPVAKLALSAVTAPTGTSITADASGSSDADGTIKSTAISFGDGTTVAGSAASHVYSTPGTYNVTVTVTDDAGASSTTSAPMTITNRAPAAKISMSTTSVYTNTAVMFSSSGSSDPDGIIASTGFDFGDGTSAVGTSVSHAYVKPGTYIAKVTVTDNLGASSSASATITVVNQNPTAKIGLSATSIFTGQSVNITSSGSSDPDGTIASIKINFGDGSSMAAASASHTYTVAGSYTISVTVTDNNGASSTATATIKVAAPGVTITKPAQNSTSTTTVNVVASAASPRPIASMIIYVDNVRTYTIYASSLNTNIALKPGTHTILVKAWEDVTGTIYQNSVVTTVK